MTDHSDDEALAQELRSALLALRVAVARGIPWQDIEPLREGVLAASNALDAAITARERREGVGNRAMAQAAGSRREPSD